MTGQRPSASRQRAERVGRWAEVAALSSYALRGFRPLGRRVRTPAGELDLILRRGRLVVFVEVKYRADLEAAALAMTPRQTQRMKRAAEFWRSRQALPVDTQFRFDLVSLAPWRLPHHVVNAFGEGY